MAEDKNTETSGSSGWGEIFDALPLDELKNNFTDYVSAWGEKAIHGLGDKVTGLIDRVSSGTDGSSAMGEAAQEGAEKLAEGDSPVTAGLSGAATGVKEKVKDTFGSGSGSSGGSESGGGKFSNIVESVDVGVPLSVAYNQWTQFQDWSGFMKKVENVEQESEEKINFKGQVFWSHRTWESTIIQQVPDEQIVWRSTGEKGHLDGAVTFHELAPRLTRILAVVEYYPQGFMEKTGNIWRAVGRRVQVEFKRYVRQVMTSTILDPDSVEGWRGEIRDSEVVRSHEEALEDEQQEDTESTEETQAEDTALEAEDPSETPAEDEALVEDEPEDELAAEDEIPAEDEPAEDEPVDEEPVTEDEAPVEEEPEGEPAAEDEIPAEDEPVSEQPDNADEPIGDENTEDGAEEPKKAPAKSSGSKSTKSTTKKRSTTAKSGSGSKSTRSTSKGKTTKSS